MFDLFDLLSSLEELIFGGFGKSNLCVCMDQGGKFLYLSNILLWESKIIKNSRESYTWIAYDHQGIIKGFQVSFVDRAFVIPVFGDYLCYRGTKHPTHIILPLSFDQFINLSTCYYSIAVLSTRFTHMSLQIETPHKVLYGWGNYLFHFKIIIDGTRTRSV